MNFLARLTATPARRTALALAALVALVTIPFAGNFALWDPWETHYGEVARQMLARNDFVSLWWPGSPLDHAPRGEFWSKPVLTFWLEALSMKLFGLEWAGAGAAEMVSSWRAEWALRAPSLVLSACSLAALFALVSRLAGRRAAAITVVALTTSPQWLLITRQAMTDMPFTAPMTIALCLGGLAILAPDETPLPRRRWGRLSWPRATAFYGFLAMFVVAALPQLLVISVQLRYQPIIFGYRIHMPGVVPMLPYLGGFVVTLWWCARATTRRELYLLSAWVLCALASLAKGPAGVGLPAIVLGLYLVCAGRPLDILRLELVRGGIAFATVAVPWWSANYIRHGYPFWREQFGDNYVNRAAGRHGDRGTFEYYWNVLGLGLFPWSGAAALGAVAAFLRPATPRQALARFALVWLLVDVSTISLVNTKFHHYVLPALPAAIILGALFLDEALAAPRKWHALGLALVGVPLTFLCGRDLAMFPPRLLWLFDYDYVLVPNVGRPWPVDASYGDRFTYGPLLWGLTTAATLAMAGLAWVVARRRAQAATAKPDASTAPEDAGKPLSPGLVAAAFVAVLAALVIAIAIGPSTTGPAPVFSPWLWLVPAAFMLGALLLVARVVRATPVWALAAVALVTSAFVADRYMPDLGPHWGQKHVIAAYYANRHGHDEPLIVWNLYWRGENFYTRNEVYNLPSGDVWAWTEPSQNHPKEWFEKHKGRRVFFLVERVKLEALRGNLPANARGLRTVDDSNNKLLLVETTL
jgi:4-amino-4-deoxy-L-arabinose transferase-like glycosyltransferase